MYLCDCYALLSNQLITKIIQLRLSIVFPLKQRVHKTPLYCIGSGPGFSICSIIFTAEYYAVDSDVTFYEKLIVLLITYCIKI